MKLFVSRVGDLATAGGSVLVVTSFWPLPDSFSYVCEAWELVIFFFFTLAIRSCCGRVEFLRGGDVSRMQEGTLAI